MSSTKGMSRKGNDEMITPQGLFNKYNRIYNFDIDAAANSKNKKTKFYYGLDNECECFRDGLKIDWFGNVWCNPPYSNKWKWVDKASKEVESRNCDIVIILLPDTMEVKKYMLNKYPKYNYELLEKRIDFIDPETMLPKKGNNGGNIVYVITRMGTII